MQWNADHPTARVHAEAQGVPQHEQDRSVVPSHRTCDAKAGASLGNELRAKKRTEQRRIAPIKRKVDFSDEGVQSPGGAFQVFYPEGTE